MSNYARHPNKSKSYSENTFNHKRFGWIDDGPVMQKEVDAADGTPFIITITGDDGSGWQVWLEPDRDSGADIPWLDSDIADALGSRPPSRFNSKDEAIRWVENRTTNLTRYRPASRSAWSRETFTNKSYRKAVPEEWVAAGENTWIKMGVTVVANGDGTYSVFSVNGEKYSDAPDEASAFAIADALLVPPETVAAVPATQEAVAPVAESVQTPAATASYRQKIRMEDAPFQTPPSYQQRSSKMEPRKSVNPDIEMPYLVRFGNESSVQKAVLTDVLGTQYRQRMWDQTVAFMKYLRWGDKELDRSDQTLLKTQIYPVDGIMKMIKSGFDVSAIKANMVESQGVLGGYAVPPQIQSEILMRLPGLTVVRGGGARVVTLTNTNSTEILEYTGGDDRYPGNIRGQWGNETTNPSAQNATLGMVTIDANVYTYKVGMSQSLVEDAANLVDIVQTDVANVLAIDEDDAFLVGDGIGKPKGILPGGANSLSLTEQNSLAAAALTATGIKKLKRAVGSQYRANAKFIANSDTYGDIEALVDGTGRYLFEDLTETDKLLQKPALESEALPDVGAGTYPVIFGDLSGYWIVERLGLTIVRFQDSNTGINKVEYHVRRRVGGRVAEPWKFGVQKVSA